jgi:hypothetical protein
MDLPQQKHASLVGLRRSSMTNQDASAKFRTATLDVKQQKQLDWSDIKQMSF